MRDSIVIYRSQIEALENLPPEQFKQAWSAIYNYAINDREPEPGDVFGQAFLGMAKPLIDKNNRHYENGKKGGRPKKNQTDTEQKPAENQTETKSKPNENQTEPSNNPNVKCKMLNEKYISSRGRFTPPTLQQVQDYVTEKGYKVDAERFIDFYESKGWFVGKNKMKDWQAAVRSWGRSQRQEVTTNDKKPFNNFPQRQYDYAELERKLSGVI